MLAMRIFVGALWLLFAMYVVSLAMPTLPL